MEVVFLDSDKIVMLCTLGISLDLMRTFSMPFDTFLLRNNCPSIQSTGEQVSLFRVSHCLYSATSWAFSGSFKFPFPLHILSFILIQNKYKMSIKALLEHNIDSLQLEYPINQNQLNTLLNYIDTEVSDREQEIQTIQQEIQSISTGISTVQDEITCLCKQSEELATAVEPAHLIIQDKSNALLSECFALQNVNALIKVLSTFMQVTQCCHQLDILLKQMPPDLIRMDELLGVIADDSEVISSHFLDNSGHPQMHWLAIQVLQVKSAVRKFIQDEFEFCLSEQGHLLIENALLPRITGLARHFEGMPAQLMDWLVAVLMKDYRSMFPRKTDHSQQHAQQQQQQQQLKVSLSNQKGALSNDNYGINVLLGAKERIEWFRRQHLHAIELSKKVFPEDWNLSRSLAFAFMKQIKDDMLST